MKKLKLKFKTADGEWLHSPDPDRGYDIYSTHFDQATLTLRHYLTNRAHESRRFESWQVEIDLAGNRFLKQWNFPLKEATAKARSLRFFNQCLYELHRDVGRVADAFKETRATFTSGSFLR